MLNFGTEYDGNDVLDCNVCIVGSGPAGVTAAWYLQSVGIDVILIDGSRDLQALGSPYNENQWLYAGPSLGLLQSNEPQFLERPIRRADSTTPSERERTFGGTSAHWGGQSRPLDPVTFEDRPGYPGWPITREDLDPAYAEYCNLMQLYGPYEKDGVAGYNFTGEFWAETFGVAEPHLDGFDTVFYQAPRTELIRFATRPFGPDGVTITQSGARVIRNASLLDIDHSNGHVSQIRVGSIDDNLQTPKAKTFFHIKAQAFVLACGAVANARQLLLSGLGNASDAVGRYFIGQPIAPGQGVHVNALSYLDTAQNAFMGYNSNVSQFGIQWMTGKFQPSADTLRNNGVGGVWYNGGGSDLYFETAPDPENRVTLASSTEPVFGQQQSQITWTPTQLDEKTYNTVSDLFLGAVTEAAKTHSPSQPVNPHKSPWQQVLGALVINGHHEGTTRMSADPKDGVVDGNLKLHEADNFYVAGSSVFTSAGLSNPTMTITSLSIRLADHLAKEMKNTSILTS